jgi:hypothetical protein
VRETHGFKDWRRGVWTALVAGCCSIAALGLFGFGAEQMNEALVVGGSIVGGYILRPVVELTWNYLWGPWRLMREEMANLAAQRHAPTEVLSPEEKRRRFQAVRTRLTLLRELEEELRGLRKSAVKLQGDGYGVAGLAHPVWGELKHEIAGIQDLQSLYEEMRDRMEELDDLPRLSIDMGDPSVDWGVLTDDGRAVLQAAVPLLDRMLKALGDEIQRLKTP